jgi:uncharacterized protein (TIGR02186 family)
MITIHKSLFYLLMLGLFIFCHNDLQAWENPENITNFKVDPDYIDIGAFFDGAQIFVSAEISECDGVVIELEGKIQDIMLNKKGKKTFLWLNVAQITVKNAPSVYILASSDKFDKICSAEELEEELIGYGALKHKIIFQSDKPLTGLEFDEFIKLKEHSGSYNINGRVKITPFSDGRQKVTTTLNIPSFIPAGKYELFLYCFKNGNLISKASSDLLIEEVGLTLLTKNLAFGNPAIYGIAAIVIALAAGIVIGLLFSKKAGGRH